MVRDNETGVMGTASVPQTEYCELSTTMMTSKSAIRKADFKDYVNSRKKDFFAEDYKKLTCGFQLATTSSLKSENGDKYENTFLEETPKVRKLNSGYTNAYFIHGYENSKYYIAAEGPKTNTIVDFWWMVWNERCGQIVMLTNVTEHDQANDVQYWSDSDRTTVGSLTIETVDVHNFTNFVTRTFCLRSGKEKKTVQHFHFTAWPDKNVPSCLSSLVLFYHKVVKTVDQNNGPMLVHCRSGIERAGTFVALDYLVHQAMQSGHVDVFRCAYNLRNQHIRILQTLEQYMFFHEVLNEVLMLPTTTTSIKEFPQSYEDLMSVDPKTGKRYVDMNFENLSFTLLCTSTSESSLGTLYENRNKNRFSNILSADDEMPRIRNENNKLLYINAVFLPGYRSKRSSIVTQMPLRETVEDFWWLLYNQNVSTVVMLNQTENDNKAEKQNIGWYWPLEAETVKFGPFRVVKENISIANKDYTTIDLVYTTNEKDKRRIRIFKSNFWPDSATIPSSVLPLLKLIKEVELHQSKKSSSPVVVHCINGAGKSGLFCVLQFVLERLKIEHDIAIHHVIRMMRCVRPSILPNLEQFKFCHDVVMEFIKLSDVSSFLK